LRKGRFDEIFFVDLPSREERKQVFEIHLKKKRRDPSTIDLGKIVEATPEFSGAEIEQVVVSALYDAFDGGGDLSTDGILSSAREIVPLAVTMKEGIDGMREWARTRARPASTGGGAASAAASDRFAVTVEPSRKLEV
jgi:SpoVK/Ycf46/Vps4 family AAA+-type ATPase